MLQGKDWAKKGSRYYDGRQEVYENGLKAALGIW